MKDFATFFQVATGHAPYPYQERLATCPELSRLLDIPTGLGKTAAVVLAWLWRRRFADEETCRRTPRRLVYCLPMRVLVEQTRDNAQRWIGKLVEARLLAEPIPIHMLMGGEDTDDWDLYPEREAILIGTQDMLLSRALNRGYGMSRYRWPMHFGLLHTDSLWVFDEIQLMGGGLATTAQIEAFRRRFNNHGCASIWMSATLQRDWLRTVDFDPAPLPMMQLQNDDRQADELRRRREAKKRLQAANARMGDAKALAEELLAAHGKNGGRTLAIVNTVPRARELFRELRKQLKRDTAKPELVLIHSRFRPGERNRQVARLLAEPGEQGMIVVSTQVVEAGVDVSATTLFTELAPWASLVQRFGRCNRGGTDNDRAQVFWIDLPADEKVRARFSLPYDRDDLIQSRERLVTCQDIGPASLPALTLPYRHGQVIRLKDFIELFDTTPDLAGNDIDIERYVREVDECDVQVFWRDWPAGSPPPADMAGPRREELCAVPVGEIRKFVEDKQRSKLAFRWDYLDEHWVAVDPNRIFPGQVYLLHCKAGGYSLDTGWDGKSTASVTVLPSQPVPPPDANDADRLSQTTWQSIAEHTDRVCQELELILAKLTVADAVALRAAARWHDRGKAHPVFQRAIRATMADGGARPVGWLDRADIAKAPTGWWQKYERKHFRHELASALAVLMAGDDQIPSTIRDLAAYLVAAHHGKVRQSIRSLPEEFVPPANRRFARGVWEDDTLPATDLGNGVIAPAVQLSLEPMELGLCEQPPFAGQPSWTERVLRLRDALGPFRLAYLEALLRATDARASRDPNPPEAHHA